MTYCIVKTCKNYHKNCTKGKHRISFHQFPSDPKRRETWNRIISLERNEPHFKANYDTRVCSVHFFDVDFITTRTGRRMLKKTALPRMPDVPQSCSLHDDGGDSSTSYIYRVFSNCSPIDEDDVDDEDDKDDEDPPETSTELVTRNAKKDNVEKSTQDVPDHLRLQRTDYKCNECDRDIFGCRYVCVQCVEHHVCATCEACGAHALHYVLRVPADKPHHEAMAILEKIREIVNIGKQENQDVPLDELESFSIKCEVETSSDPLNDENVVKIEINEEPLEINEFDHAPRTDEEATIEGNTQTADPKRRQQGVKRKAPSDTLPNTPLRTSLDQVIEVIAKRNKIQSSRDPVPNTSNTINDPTSANYQVPTDTKPNLNAPMTFNQVPGSVVPVIMYNIPKCEDGGGLQPDHTSATISSQALVVSFDPLQPAEDLVIKTELPDY